MELSVARDSGGSKRGSGCVNFEASEHVLPRISHTVIRVPASLGDARRDGRDMWWSRAIAGMACSRVGSSNSVEDMAGHSLFASCPRCLGQDPYPTYRHGWALFVQGGPGAPRR
jgi:hypothetical protein